jgi:hypothetical protein
MNDKRVGGQWLRCHWLVEALTWLRSSTACTSEPHARPALHSYVRRRTQNVAFVTFFSNLIIPVSECGQLVKHVYRSL